MASLSPPLDDVHRDGAEASEVTETKLNNQLEGLLENNLVLQDRIKRILTNSESFSTHHSSFISPRSFMTEEEATRSMTMDHQLSFPGSMRSLVEPAALEARYTNLWQENRELETRHAHLQATCDQLELELMSREELYDLRLQEMEACVEMLASANQTLRSAAQGDGGAAVEPAETLSAVQSLATAQQQELLRLYRYVREVDDGGISQVLQLFDMESIQRTALEKVCEESANLILLTDRQWLQEMVMHPPTKSMESAAVQTDILHPPLEEIGVQTDPSVSPTHSLTLSPVLGNRCFSPPPRSLTELFGSDIVVERVVTNFDDCDAFSEASFRRVPQQRNSGSGSWHNSPPLPPLPQSACTSCPALQQKLAAATEQGEEQAKELQQLRAELEAVSGQNRSLMQDLSASNACQAALEDGLRRGRAEQQAWAEEREHLERQVEQLTRQHGLLKEHLRSVMAEVEAVATRREEEETSTVAALEEARLALAREQEQNSRLRTQLRLLAESSASTRDSLPSLLASHLTKVNRAERTATCGSELRVALQALRQAVTPYLPAQDSPRTRPPVPLPRSNTTFPASSPRTRENFTPRSSVASQSSTPRSMMGNLERPLSARGHVGSKAVP